MKKGVHPDSYRPVVFQDTNDGTMFLTRSTADAEETISLDGAEYPLVKIHISSSSHPFFTGQEKLVDIEGRVDKFKARQAAAKKAQETRAQSKPKDSRKRKESSSSKLVKKPS